MARQFRLSQFLYVVSIFALTLLLGTKVSRAQSSSEVCASPEVATTESAMVKIFQYHAKALVEMGRQRGVPLPMFGRDDPIPISRHIAKYLGEREKSALVIFAADRRYICSYLFSIEYPQPLYQRQKISVTDVQDANGELRRTILCNHIDSSRAPRLKRDGSVVPWFVDATDQATSCKKLTNSVDSVSLLSRIFFPIEFREALQNIKRLAILPIRSLSAVPVAVLNPLGDDRQTVDIFSVNFVAFLPDIRHAAPKLDGGFAKPLIVGDPEANTDPDYDFAPLPGALKEAEALHKFFGGDILRRANAKLGSFTKKAVEADLIYVAAHGLSEFENSMDMSFIAMSDGRLTARRVQELKLKRSPLVVLSACQTGLGTVVEAGIIGIGRAFQKAGARNTVMSLWNVFDGPTFYMMTEFRKQVTSNHPAEALRLAMLAGRKKYPEPVNWSGFMVLGN